VKKDGIDFGVILQHPFYETVIFALYIGYDEKNHFVDDVAEFKHG
jgi:hypothetical protein